MKLHKKIAIVFTYIALCIAVSGYLYPDKTNYEKILILSDIDGFTDDVIKSIREGNRMFNNSLIIEGTGLFLLLGWFAYKEDK